MMLPHGPALAKGLFWDERTQSQWNKDKSERTYPQAQHLPNCYFSKGIIHELYLKRFAAKLLTGLEFSSSKKLNSV